MRICLISTSLGMGGAENQVCNLADSFANKGHDVMIISLNLETSVKPNNKKVKIVELNMKKTPLGFILSYLKARKVIKEFNHDVIHSHMVHANIFARLLRLTTKFKKLICTAHSVNEGTGLRLKVYKYTDFLCDIMTNVSGEAVKEFIKIGICSHDKIKLVNNGIDTNKFNKVDSLLVKNELNIKEDTKLLLAVGRLDTVKDYPTMIKAMNLVVDNGYHDIHLAIIGTGENQQLIESEIKDLNLHHHVSLIGRRYDVNKWMSDSDVLLMSSTFEGMPLVVGEAMASKCFIIATDCGGIGEISGEHSLLSQVGEERELARNIIKYLGMNEQEIQNHLDNGRNRIVTNYSINSISDQWLEMYK